MSSGRPWRTRGKAPARPVPPGTGATARKSRAPTFGERSGAYEPGHVARRASPVFSAAARRDTLSPHSPRVPRATPRASPRFADAFTLAARQFGERFPRSGFPAARAVRHRPRCAHNRRPTAPSRTRNSASTSAPGPLRGRLPAPGRPYGVYDSLTISTGGIPEHGGHGRVTAGPTDGAGRRRGRRGRSAGPAGAWRCSARAGSPSPARPQAAAARSPVSRTAARSPGSG